MDPFRQVNAGEPLRIPAPTWNRLMEVGRHFTRHRAEVGPPPSPDNALPPAVRVYVRNDTGGDLPARAVVGLDTPPLDPTVTPYDAQQAPLFGGIAPAGAGSAVAVVEGPLASGAVGRAVVMGVAVVSLAVGDAGHEYCGPTASQTGYLTTAATGPIRVLWKESGTGSKLGVVLLQAVGSPAPTTDVWVVTKVCPTVVGGAVVHVVQERQQLRVPSSWLIGDPVCTTDAADCCEVPLSCPGCDAFDMPPNACLVLAARSGVAADAGFTPLVIPLVGAGTSTTFNYAPRDRVPSGPYAGVFNYTTGGGTAAWVYLSVSVGCAESGDPIGVQYTGTWVGAGAAVGPLSPAAAAGDLPSGPFDSPTISFTTPLVQFGCDTFTAASGSVLLGTVSGYCNGTGGPATSFDVYLAWGTVCELAADPPAEACPPNCDLSVSFDWNDGESSGFYGFTIPLDWYDPLTGTIYWYTTHTDRCGTNIAWVVTCDGSGAMSLLGYDGETLVFAATFAPSGTAGTWTGTVVTACGDITAVTLSTTCSPLRDGTVVVGVA